MKRKNFALGFLFAVCVGGLLAATTQINLATQVMGQLAIARVGSSGLSGSSPITVASSGAVACPTCIPSALTWSNFNGVVNTVIGVTSATTRLATLIQVPYSITVNDISVTVTVVSGTGTLKECVYDSTGTTKLIDVTSATLGSGVVTTAVSSVALGPGTYYAVIGCGSSCNVNVAGTTAPSATTLFGTGTPSGKPIWYGTVSHTSGTCNTSLGTITGAQSITPTYRFDN